MCVLLTAHACILSPHPIAHRMTAVSMLFGLAITTIALVCTVIALCYC